MFFESLWLFLAYSFLGWVFETTVAAIRRQHFYNRGVINGPFCLIYGCGGLTITIFGGELHGIWLYIGSVIVATVVEWIAGHLIERWYHERWWDYSNIPLNLQGRICLPVSLFWGLLSVVMAEWIQPLMDQVVSQIPRRAGELAGYVIAVVFCSDIAVTVAAALQLDRKLADMQRLREEFAASMERLKLFESREELREKLADSPFYTYFGNKKIEFEQNVEKWLEKYKLLAEKREEESSRIRTELKNRAEELRAAYRKQRSSRLNQMIYRRIFRAFPHMKATRGQEILEAWKERIRKRKK